MDNLNNSAPAPDQAPPVQNIEPVPIAPVPMTNKPLDIPGFSMDPGLASRLNQAPQSGRKLPIKLIVIVALVLILVGGTAYAWFFTNLKYKLPWFKPAEDKLVGMMYESLAKLDGADFAVTYKLSVGDRDADVKKVDEKKVSDREARRRLSYVKSALSQLKYGINNCFTSGLMVQANSSQSCDGSDKAQPKADTDICLPKTTEINTSPIVIKDYDNYYGSYEIWPDLSQYEWEYDQACQSDLSLKTFSFSAHSTYNDDKITCTEKGCVSSGGDTLELDTSSEFDFLLGEYLTEFDNYITTNFNLQATFTGSGFSLKERDKEKKQLPNVEMSLDGSADLGSFSGKVQLAAKVIEDFIYYKVDAFPFIDITQGHESEWIKAGLEDDDSSEIGYMLGDLTSNIDNDQNEAVKKFRDFIAQSKDYSVLEFKATGKYLETHGVQSPLFEVKIIPEKVPSWLEALKKIYDQVENTSGGARVLDLSESNPDWVNVAPTEAKSETLTDKEKTKIIEQIKKINENLKISVALHPGTGDLMNLSLNFRIIPPPEVKKFATKQFNSNLMIDMWNHNNPTEPKVPDKFIEQSEIDRERLGYSQEAYQDILQSKRVQLVRRDLLNYYNENQAWPQKLSDASKLITDLNTGKEYPYQVIGNNYILTYQMGDVEQKANPKNTSRYYSPYNKQLKGFGTNSLTRAKEYWDKGENKADRYSPVAHKYTSSRQWLVGDTNHFDTDVLQNLEQARIIKKLGTKINSFYAQNKRYPDSLSDLDSLSYWEYDPLDSYSYGSKSTSNKKYHCEDLSLAKPCEYQKLADNFSLKVNYTLTLDNIDKTILASNKYYMVSWYPGLNQYDKTSIDQELGSDDSFSQYTDSDMDGLLDVDESKYGTSKYNSDTDYDGFSDGEEVKNGYNPNGSGKLSDVSKNTSNIKYTKVSTSDWIKGDSKATVTLIVYSDADCPYCAQFHETTNQVLKDYSGKVKVVYRHFPLSSLHPGAPIKAEAIECVGELGGNTKVWAFLDKLFVDTNKPTESQLGDTVASLGIDKTKFQTCLDSSKYASKINAQVVDAQAAGAQGTPYSLLIKGDSVTPINGAYPYNTLKPMIDNLLK